MCYCRWPEFVFPTSSHNFVSIHRKEETKAKEKRVYQKGEPTKDPRRPGDNGRVSAVTSSLNFWSCMLMFAHLRPCSLASLRLQVSSYELSDSKVLICVLLLNIAMSVKIEGDRNRNIKHLLILACPGRAICLYILYQQSGVAAVTMSPQYTCTACMHI